MKKPKTEEWKIVIITRSFPRRNTPGFGYHPYRLANGLQWPAMVLTRKTDEPYLESREHVKLLELPYEDKAIGISATFFRLYYYIHNVFQQVMFFSRARKAVKDFKPDIIHLHSANLLFVGLLMKRYLSVPLVVFFIGSDSMRVANNRLLQTLFGSVDRIVCVSKSMRTTLSRVFPLSKLVYCPTGVDMDMYKSSSIDKRKRQIIYVGRLSWAKGLQYLIEAAATILRRFPDYRLVMVGDGEDFQSLKQMIEHYSLQNRVTLLGMLPRSEVAHLMQQSRFLVMSSISEGLPKVLLESLSCGTPAVVTDVGDCADVLGGAGIVVSTRSPQLLAEAMERMIVDEDLWRSCALKARKQAESFTWDNMISCFRNEYRQILMSA